MLTGKDFDHNVIIRFLMQEASKADISRLRRRIEADADFKKHFEQIRDTWNSIELEKDLDETKVHYDLDKVIAKIGIDSKTHQGRQFSLKFWIPVAASIFLIGFALSWFTFSYPNDSTSQTVIFSTIETPRGSNSIIYLSDGSKITLNAESKIRYPEKFSGQSREVYLEGEAFFEITKDERRQFIVKTPEIAVKVFGTSFNIKNYPNENMVETTLVEGAITLFKTSEKGDLVGKEIKMEPNQQVVLYKTPRVSEKNEPESSGTKELPKAIKPRFMITKRIDTEKFTSWKDGQLKIQSESLEKLALTLERRYDVILHFEEKQIRQYRFTGIIENETIEQVMAAIKLASPIDYKMEEREIWIKSKD